MRFDQLIIQPETYKSGEFANKVIAIRIFNNEKLPKTSINMYIWTKEQKNPFMDKNINRIKAVWPSLILVDTFRAD